jgi:type II restriction enzyme
MNGVESIVACSSNNIILNGEKFIIMNKPEIVQIENVLRTCLRNKFQNYNPEPASMPFHTRLLGKDRLALYAFIHSLNTNFGTAIFEPVALALAQNKFQNVKLQAKAGDQISKESHKVIQEIMDGLATAENTPNKAKEIATIRKVCQKGKMQKVKLTQVDIWMESKSGELFLFDI